MRATGTRQLVRSLDGMARQRIGLRFFLLFVSFLLSGSILVALVLLYVSYHQTSVFWVLLVLGGVGFWLFNVRKSAIVISGRVFAEKEVMIAFAVFTATVLFYVGNNFLIYSLAFAGLLILLHAGLKSASIEARATNAVSSH